MSFDNCLAELRSRALLPHGMKSVFVGGSLVRGWGNVTSDLDVYIITSEPWSGPTVGTQVVALDPDAIPVETFYIDGQRWDVEYWLESQVDQLLGKVRWPDEGETTEVVSGMNFCEKDFLERIGHGVPLHGADWLERTRKAVEESAFRFLMAAWMLNTADNYVEDAAGQLKSGDIESAVLSARIAFGFTVDALMCSVGETGQNPKWRARRVRESALEALPFEAYWAVETMRDLPQGAEQWVESVLMLCKRLSLEVGA